MRFRRPPIGPVDIFGIDHADAAGDRERGVAVRDGLDSVPRSGRGG
jgi:hypothetical protein